MNIHGNADTGQFYFIPRGAGEFAFTVNLYPVVI